MSNEQPPTLAPPDVAWRRLATPGRIRTGSDALGLHPSISAFYHLVPMSTDPGPYGNDRILLLKIVPTFTGLTPTTDDALRTIKTIFGNIRLPQPDAIGTLPSSYVPCYGGCVLVSLKAEPSSAPSPYFREVFPRHQEMVINEVLGNETLNRQSSRVSTTRTWNATGRGSYSGVEASTSFGGSSVSETQSESSQRNTHTTSIEHVYHVITAYHLGGTEASFVVQPRPFEGEHWELLSGIRKVEGIQEFLLIAHLPAAVDRIRIRVQFRPGWFWSEPGPLALRAPMDPAEKVAAIQDELEGKTLDFFTTAYLESATEQAANSIKAWERWIGLYRRWMEVHSFVASTLRASMHTLIAETETTATVDLATDSAQDHTPSDNSTFSTDVLAPLHYSPTAQAADATQARLQINARMDQLAECLRRAFGSAIAGVAFEHTAMAQHWTLATAALLSVREPLHPFTSLRVPEQFLRGMKRPLEISKDEWDASLAQLRTIGEFARYRLGGGGAETAHSRAADALRGQLLEKVALGTRYRT